MPFYGVREKGQSRVRMRGLMERPRYEWRAGLPRIRCIPFESLERAKTACVAGKADTEHEVALEITIDSSSLLFRFIL